MGDTGERGKDITLGKNLRKYRKKLGYSQGDLGQKLGKTQTAISEMELGKNLKNIEDINAMLDIFKNITYEELFDTGRTSIYISESNDIKLEENIKNLTDVFSPGMTDHEKKAIIVNLILKIFLDNDLSLDIKEKLKNEIQRLSVI